MKIIKRYNMLVIIFVIAHLIRCGHDNFQTTLTTLQSGFPICPYYSLDGFCLEIKWLCTEWDIFRNHSTLNNPNSMRIRMISHASLSRSLEERSTNTLERRLRAENELEWRLKWDCLWAGAFRRRQGWRDVVDKMFLLKWRKTKYLEMWNKITIKRMDWTRKYAKPSTLWSHSLWNDETLTWRLRALHSNSNALWHRKQQHQPTTRHMNVTLSSYAFFFPMNLNILYIRLYIAMWLLCCRRWCCCHCWLMMKICILVYRTLHYKTKQYSLIHTTEG